MFAKEIKELRGIEKAYIQVINGEYVNDAAFYFNNGCKLLGIETEKFEDKDFGNIKLQKNEMIFAGVPVMIKTFEKFGGIIPDPLDIPSEIETFCGRIIKKSTLKELYDNTSYPIFVKPAHKGKLFDGQIVSCKEELELFQYVDEEDGWNTRVFSSEVIKIISEFRCFIIKGEVYDCRKYKGEFSATPDFEIIKECVNQYKSAPVAYALDFGVTDKGETILIEANDGYSLGPYGFDSYNYTRMMILRWKQLMRLDS
jgi:hypothetical protein